MHQHQRAPGRGRPTPTCTTTTGPWALADPGTAIAAAVAVPVVDSYTVAVPFTVAPRAHAGEPDVSGGESASRRLAG
ncbi:MAG: hypothetical protein IPI73_03375 [Betaproteobacteria bacterium]|nr:hypothetical protein [Betaproteobacteria bacterium]